MVEIALATISFVIWVYLLVGRGGFWLMRERDSETPEQPAGWPAVAAVVPARDEADHVGHSISSLLDQDYRGPFTVILVDDESRDGTADVARAVAERHGEARELLVLRSAPLPSGWTGKLWAVKQGIDAARRLSPAPTYLLLTDADIVHAPDSLRWLSAHAQRHRLALASFMAELRCETLAERVHVPAFIFFFQMLFPFRWCNQPRAVTAAAAGGCMLVDRERLEKAGGIESIRDSLIDDCALAEKLKGHGPIWIGVTKRVRSIRPYGEWMQLRRMIARSAYAQLRYSPLLLLFTVCGMAMTFIAPVFFTLLGTGVSRWLGAGAWALMAIAFQPTLRFYGLSPFWGLALPGIALLYLLYTLDSAYQYACGLGGSWKGRVQAHLSVKS